MVRVKANKFDKQLIKLMKQGDLRMLRYGNAATYPAAYKYLDRAPGKLAHVRIIKIINGRAYVYVHEYSQVKYKCGGYTAWLYTGIPSVNNRTPQNQNTCKQLVSLLRNKGYYQGII